jgi:hypothetical protein
VISHHMAQSGEGVSKTTPRPIPTPTLVPTRPAPQPWPHLIYLVLVTLLLLSQEWYGISTHPNRRIGYLLPSQQLNLNDHATSDIHLLRLFLFGDFSPFGPSVLYFVQFKLIKMRDAL